MDANAVRHAVGSVVQGLDPDYDPLRYDVSERGESKVVAASYERWAFFDQMVAIYRAIQGGRGSSSCVCREQVASSSTAVAETASKPAEVVAETASKPADVYEAVDMASKPVWFK